MITHPYPESEELFDPDYDLDDYDDVHVKYEELKRETDKAYLFIIEDEDYWLPKSQIVNLDEAAQEIIIPRWLANKNRL